MSRARLALLPLLLTLAAAGPAAAQDPAYPTDPAEEGVVVLPDEDYPAVEDEDPADQVPVSSPWPGAPGAPGVPGAPVAPTAPVQPALPKVVQKTGKDAISASPRLTGPTVPGRTAIIKSNGFAVPPAAAPLAVKRMIWTANRMIGLRYIWGGGHRSFADRGYDCSGAVSFALHAADLLGWPMVSGELAKWGRPGGGRWVTIYANRTHVFMRIAGIRLDTSPVADPAGGNGPRWRPAWRPTARFHVRHPAGL